MTASTNLTANWLNNWQLSPLAQSEIELRGEIDAETFASFRSAALKKLGDRTTLDGFRPGHIPEAKLEQALGEAAILEEMATLAVGKIYPELIKAHQIDALGTPQITVTKLAKGNPLGLIIKTAVLPAINLGDYRATTEAVRQEIIAPLPVTDEEIDKIVTDISTKHPNAKELENKDEFRAKIRTQLEADRVREAREKKRLKLVEVLIKAIPFDLPIILIESETNRLLAELKANLERFSLKFEDYLAHLKKTEAELREKLTPEAEKQIRIHLILGAILKAEKLDDNLELAWQKLENV